MKKIFTFLFLTGLVTGAMAQDSRNAQYRGQSNGYAPSPVYSANNQSSGGYASAGHSENGYAANSNYGYDNNRGYETRGSDYRDNGDRFHDDDRYTRRERAYEREVYARRNYEGYNRGRFDSRVVVRFGRPSCY